MTSFQSTAQRSDTATRMRESILSTRRRRRRSVSGEVVKSWCNSSVCTSSAGTFKCCGVENLSIEKAVGLFAKLDLILSNQVYSFSLSWATASKSTQSIHHCMGVVRLHHFSSNSRTISSAHSIHKQTRKPMPLQVTFRLLKNRSMILPDSNMFIC